MIFDLEKIGKGTIKKNPEILIIGAGTAGLYLANKLMGNGLNIVVLDQGSLIGKRTDKSSVINTGMPYEGSYRGRSFGVGGTSTLWGGQMIPLSELDFNDRRSKGLREWPIKYQDLIPYYENVCKSLNLNNYNGNSLKKIKKRFFPKIYNLNQDFSLRLSQWISFKKRNFGKYYYKKILHNRNSGVEIWTNALTTKIIKSKESENYKIIEVLARSPSGKLLSISADKVIICAGTLESTRLLLEFESENLSKGFSVSPALGLFFSDHLSINLGEIIPNNFKDINLMLAPIFYKGVMHTPRLELSAKYQELKGTPSAFIHFTFITKGDTFFDFVRDFLRSKQDSRKIQKKYSTLFVFQSIFGLFLMAFWRFFYRRLKFPKGSKVLMQIDFEQVANKNSTIRLGDEKDGDNRKKLILDWKLTEKEMEVINTTSKNMVKFFQNSTLKKYFLLKSSLEKNKFDANNIYDVYHPTGTISMGDDKQNSVVDVDLKLHGCSNLYVSSTAVFPSPGSANPGMTHLALTDRLGDLLLKQQIGDIYDRKYSFTDEKHRESLGVE